MTTAVAISKKKSRKRSTDSSILDRLEALHWSVWLLLFVIVFFAIVRFRLRDVALERDEGEYAYSGQLILQGIPPYQLAYNMKLPGTYASYAVIMALFGQSSSGIHIGLLLMNALTSWMIFLLGRKLFGTVAGAFAGMCYALATASPVLTGFAAHATNFVVFAAVPGILLLLAATERDSAPLLFGAGTCFGLAFVMKQPGAVFAVFALLYFLYEKRDRLDWNYAFPRVSALLAGTLWPFALTCILLYRAGVFKNFWFWTFSYASVYATEVTSADAITSLLSAAAHILSVEGATWILAVIGLVILLRDSRFTGQRFFVGALLVCSAIGISAGFYFRGHYFILILPAVSLLAGLAISCAPDVFYRWPSVEPVAKWAPLAVFVIAFAITLYQERRFVFASNALAASNVGYPDNPFLAAREVGKYIQSASSPEARVAVFGSEPEIFFYSQRRSATGYIYTYGLMENQQYAARMQQEMIQEITRTQPEFVVFVDDELSWLWKHGETQEQFFYWIQAYINGQYTKVAQVDVGGESGHLLGNIPRIYVFRRKPH